jgi:hypothetical protein
MANPYRNAFVTSIDSIPSSGDTLNLAVSQIGVFNADTYQAVTNPNFPTVKAIIIAQGRDAQTFPSGVGLTNENPKTQPIKAHNILGWEAKKAQKPQNMIVALGFDGIDDTKTFAPSVGKDVKIFVTMSGTPIANLMGGSSTTHYNTLTEEFTPVFPCADDCADNCGDTVDCNVAVDAFIKEFNERKIIGGELLSKYIRVSKVTSCETPSGLPTVDCQKWTLTVADAGNQEALGAVQAQVGSVEVSRISRDGIYSVYELTVCDESTPTAFSSADITIPNCDVCPSGATLVDSVNAYTIVRAGNQTTGTINGAYAAVISGVSTKLAFANGVSTFLLYSTDNLATVAAVVATDVVAEAGVAQSVCTVPGTSTAWVEGDTCKKASKVYKLSYSNTPCGDSILTTLQALYSEVGTVTEGSTDNCVTEYFITITSDTSCEECADNLFKFKVPDPYQGSAWVEQSADPVGTGCVCGVKFESAYIQRERKECYFDAVSYEVEPLFIAVSTINPNTLDYSTLCDPLAEQIPVTKLQNIKYASGYGSSVLSERVKLSNFYYNRPWKTDPAERAAMAYELGIDLQGYYDEYILTYAVDLTDGLSFSGFGSSQKELHEEHVFFPAGQGADFVTAINSFVASANTGVAPVVI